MLKKMKRAAACFLACALSVSCVGVSFADEIDTAADTEQGIVDTLTEENTDEIIAEPEVSEEPEITEEPTAEPEITEEPTAEPEITEEPTAEPDTIVYEEITEEYLRGLEFTGGNIRIAFDFLGGIDGFYPENYTDEELQEFMVVSLESEDVTMNDVVDLILWRQSISTNGLTDRTLITVSPSSSEVLATSFEITYGNEVKEAAVAFEFDELDPSDLIIEPTEGYKLTQVKIVRGDYYADETTMVSERDLTQYIGEDGSYVFTKELLIDENKGYYDEIGRRANYFDIEVTTARADVGTFSVTDDYDEASGLERATYTLSNTGAESDTASGLQEAIATAISNDIIQYGNDITITVEPSKIASVEYTQGTKTNTINFDKATKSFTIPAGADDVSISFTYKSKAGVFSLSSESNIKEADVTSVNYTFTTLNGTQTTGTALSIDELNKAIQNQYSGTTMTLTVNFADKTNTISSVSWNDAEMPTKDNIINNIVLDGTANVLLLNVKTSTPRLRVYKYDNTFNNNDVIILAEIENFDNLENADSAVTEQGFDTVLKTTDNPGREDGAEEKVEAKRAGAFWGMYFTPKEGEDFKYNYKYDINATMRYDGADYSSKIVEINFGPSQVR